MAKAAATIGMDLQGLDLTEILAEGNEEYPFNNIATTCRLMGETSVPERFGGDCFDQVTRMIRRIREAGQRALYISSGVHFAAFLPDIDGGVYLDPTLNMREPIALPSLRDNTAYRAETYPLVGGVSSFIGATLSNGVLKSDWHKAMMSREGTALTRRLPPHNTFQLDRAGETFTYNPQMVRRFFASDMVPRLHWNALNTETGEVITITVDTDSVGLRSSARSGRLSDSESVHALEKVASLTGVTRQEVDEFLRLGQAKFQELKAGAKRP